MERILSIYYLVSPQDFVILDWFGLKIAYIFDSNAKCYFDIGGIIKPHGDAPWNIKGM